MEDDDGEEEEEEEDDDQEEAAAVASRNFHPGGLMREKSFDVETDDSSEDDASFSDPLPPLPTHTSAHRDHNKITTATTTTTTTTTDERKETTLVGSISTSLDRSGRARPSPLAGCLAPSPPARSIELSAVSFAFNKNLAQMAVAKSAGCVCVIKLYTARRIMLLISFFGDVF